MANSNNHQPAKSPRVTRRKKSLLSWNLKRDFEPAVKSVALCLVVWYCELEGNFLFIFLSCTYSRKPQFSSPFALADSALEVTVLFFFGSSMLFVRSHFYDYYRRFSFISLWHGEVFFFSLRCHKLSRFFCRSFCAVSGRMQELLRLCCARSAFSLDCNCNCNSTCTQGVQRPRVKWEIDGKSVARELEHFEARRRKWTRHQSWTPFSSVWCWPPGQSRFAQHHHGQFNSVQQHGLARLGFYWTPIALCGDCEFTFFFFKFYTQRERGHTFVVIDSKSDNKNFSTHSFFHFFRKKITIIISLLKNVIATWRVTHDDDEGDRQPADVWSSPIAIYSEKQQKM